MAMSQADKQKLLDKMRSKQKEQSGSRDPSEWRPEKVKPGETKEYRGFILPPLSAGDTTSTGPAKTDWNGSWNVPHGHHFVNGKKFECPRVHVEQESCPMCETGFDLMRETQDKAVKSALAKEWLARQGWGVNIYFEDVKSNPEELRGKVKWWSIPKAVHDRSAKVLEATGPGDSPEDDPQAFGLFCDPDAAFPLKIVVVEKSDYNNYDSCAFIGRARPIADSQEKITAILAQRHDIPSKFFARDLSLLNKLVADKAGVVTTTPAPTAAPKPAAAAVATAPVSTPKVETKVTEAKAAPAAPAAQAPAAAEAAPAADGEQDPEMLELLAQLKSK